MKKKLCAYFFDLQTARKAVFDISPLFIQGGEITLSEASSSESCFFNSCIIFTFFGSALGCVTSLFSSFISPIGNSLLAGLLCGSTVGAIIGSLTDVIKEEKHPFCIQLTLLEEKKKYVFLSRRLKYYGTRLFLCNS